MGGTVPHLLLLPASGSCSWSLTPLLGLLLRWHSSALRVSALGVEVGSAGLQGRGGSLYPGVSQDQRASLCSCRVLRRTEEFTFAKLVAPDQVGAVFKVCFRGFLSTLGPAAWDPSKGRDVLGGKSDLCSLNLEPAPTFFIRDGSPGASPLLSRLAWAHHIYISHMPT